MKTTPLQLQLHFQIVGVVMFALGLAQSTHSSVVTNLKPPVALQNGAYFCGSVLPCADIGSAKACHAALGCDYDDYYKECFEWNTTLVSLLEQSVCEDFVTEEDCPQTSQSNCAWQLYNGVYNNNTMDDETMSSLSFKTRDASFWVFWALFMIMLGTTLAACLISVYLYGKKLPLTTRDDATVCTQLSMDDDDLDKDDGKDLEVAKQKALSVTGSTLISVSEDEDCDAQAEDEAPNATALCHYGCENTSSDDCCCTTEEELEIKKEGDQAPKKQGQEQHQQKQQQRDSCDVVIE